MTERLTFGSAAASLTGLRLGTGSVCPIVLNRLSGVGVGAAFSVTGRDSSASSITVIVTECGNLITDNYLAANRAGILGIALVGTVGLNNDGGGLVTLRRDYILLSGNGVAARALYTRSQAVLGASNLNSLKDDVVKMSQSNNASVNV